MQTDTDTITDQEIDQLEELLDSDIFNHEALPLDALQGFLCAVISGPGVIPPAVWIPAALGESPHYESEQQAQEVMDLVMKFYDSIATTLAAGEDLELMLYADEADPEELDYAPWSEGYIYGTQLSDTNWIESAGEYAPDLTEKMETFFLLSGMLKEDTLRHKEPWLSKQEEARAMDAAKDDFPDTIGAIYRFWEAWRTPQSPVKRETPKVGRNDSCPCGSGKKFKDCCGKEPTLH